MSWWNKIFAGDPHPRSVDYYHEGLELLNDGKYHEALTSFRLALKEAPGDPVVLQQIAIAYTRIGMTEEAAKTYRHVLKNQPDAPGAHYGLAFLYLRGGQHSEAVRHLKAFLGNAPKSPDAAEHVQHARETLAELSGEGVGGEEPL
jgi:tetratricopeptide (TPR) repeat protein